MEVAIIASTVISVMIGFYCAYRIGGNYKEAELDLASHKEYQLKIAKMERVTENIREKYADLIDRLRKRADGAYELHKNTVPVDDNSEAKAAAHHPVDDKSY